MPTRSAAGNTPTVSYIDEDGDAITLITENELERSITAQLVRGRTVPILDVVSSGSSGGASGGGVFPLPPQPRPTPSPPTPLAFLAERDAVIARDAIGFGANVVRDVMGAVGGGRGHADDVAGIINGIGGILFGAAPPPPPPHQAPTPIPRPTPPTPTPLSYLSTLPPPTTVTSSLRRESITHSCDICNVSIGINAFRWKCLICPDFDACANCFTRMETLEFTPAALHDSQHAFIRLSNPNQVPAALIVIPNEEEERGRGEDDGWDRTAAASNTTTNTNTTQNRRWGPLRSPRSDTTNCSPPIIPHHHHYHHQQQQQPYFGGGISAFHGPPPSTTTNDTDTIPPTHWWRRGHGEHRRGRGHWRGRHHHHHNHTNPSDMSDLESAELTAAIALSMESETPSSAASASSAASLSVEMSLIGVAVSGSGSGGGGGGSGESRLQVLRGIALANTGVTAWPSDTRLVLEEGDALGLPTNGLFVGAVPSHDTLSLALHLAVPVTPQDNFLSIWRLATNGNVFFGPPLALHTLLDDMGE